MVERVGDDGIFCGEEWFEESAVSIEARPIENGVLGVEIVGDGSFELFVEVLCATDEAHRRHAVAVGVHRLLGSLDDARVVREAKIVVGAEVEHLGVFAHADVSTLWGGDEAFVLIQSCCMDVV